MSGGGRKEGREQLFPKLKTADDGKLEVKRGREETRTNPPYPLPNNQHGPHPTRLHSHFIGPKLLQTRRNMQQHNRLGKAHG